MLFTEVLSIVDKTHIAESGRVEDTSIALGHPDTGVTAIDKAVKINFNNHSEQTRRGFHKWEK